MTKCSFAFGAAYTYIWDMRIFLIFVMVLSFGFTRAAPALPMMTTGMSMAEMATVTNADQPMHHDMASNQDMGGKAKSAPQHPKSALSHGICALCYPALASVQQAPRAMIGERFALPVAGAELLAPAPEPLSPPPRTV